MNKWGVAMDDRYGSTFREGMKESMRKPARFRPLNHVERCLCALCNQKVEMEPPLGFVHGFFWMLAILMFSVVGIGALIGIEQGLKHLLSK